MDNEPLTMHRPPIRLLVLCLAAFTVSAGAQDKLNYARDIQPILSENCFACHGFDEKARKAKLRLDTPEGARAKHKSQAAIVPGQPDQSEALKRILTTDPDDRMPPEESGKKLTPKQIDLIKRWISEGADYTGHWSFGPIQSPAVPPGGNPIDHFIQQKLQANGLQTSPQADRATLLRRVTFDLTGLPPTPQEIDAFLNDSSPDAYDKVVDRLLASPHYGERMALEWLDAARYADTHGYHIDSGRDMTRWREWVIDAFNANKPFDQFTVEQLAGDLLPDATLDQKVASGFNRNHMINFEGGAVPEEYHAAYLMDRVNTTTTVWLGLTVACAQCHDHKYDPVTQKEYYQLYAFFNNVPEKGLDGNKGNAAPMIRTPTAAEQKKLDDLAAQVASLRQSLEAPDAEADAAQAEWERTAARHGPTSWTNLDPATISAAHGSKLDKLANQVIRATGPNPAKESYTLRVNALPAAATALRFEMFPDDALADKGPGRSSNGNVVLTEFNVFHADKPVKLRRASADFAQKDFPASNAIDNKPDTGWAIHPETGKPHHLTVELEDPLPGGAPVTVVAEFYSKFAGHQPARFRLSATDSATPHDGRQLPEAVADALATPSDRRTDAQRTALRRYYRTNVSAAYGARSKQLAYVEKTRVQLDASVRTTMVMQEMATPRDTHLLERGQYDKRGEKVAPNTPTLGGALPPLSANSTQRPRNRLDLASWLVSKDNPLTARVIVNRYWQMYFGNGIVKTSEDLGTQGEWPTHPALLDYLASRFVGTGWNVKAMQRLIVTSAAYRQSSRATPDLIAKDPENRLLARGPRVRLPAEFIRDQALALAGLLNPEIGGHSVSPYQPAGLWEELMSRADGANWSAQTYVQSRGKDLYRRTMYTFWKRTSPPPTLATFDAPDREVCTVRRARTNTPLQALVLMNDPTYVEASRKLAERLLRDAGPSADDRITFAFRLATARPPKPAEIDVLRRALDQHLARYRAHPDLAQKLLTIGEAPADPKFDQPELAAWTILSSTLLNLDETVTKN